MTAPAPKRLVLTAAELAYLVRKTDVELPPSWRPDPETELGLAESGLTKKKVVTGVGEEATVHPSVEKNLRILAHPAVLLETVATAAGAGSRSVHAVAGPLGASLFDLGDGAVELSMFAAVALGRELIRAVPEPAGTVGSALDATQTAAPPAGRVPLTALRELGMARLMSVADPRMQQAVLSELDLPAAEAEIAKEVADRSDGALRCTVTGRSGDRVVTSSVSWLHTDGGWTELEPDPDGSGREMMRLVPTQRENLGTSVAPAVAVMLP